MVDNLQEGLPDGLGAGLLAVPGLAAGDQLSELGIPLQSQRPTLLVLALSLLRPEPGDKLCPLAAPLDLTQTLDTVQLRVEITRETQGPCGVRTVS